MKEIWKDIEGYKGHYQASNLGRIKSLERKSINSGNIFTVNEKIIGSDKQSGYRDVVLYKDEGKKFFREHRLVAKAFIPNPNNYLEVNHIDGNKLNNNVNNLEWCTNIQNQSHAWKNGLKNNNHFKGEGAHFSKLTEFEARLIYKLKTEYNMKNKILSCLFKISERNIRAITSKATWKHIHPEAI